MFANLADLSKSIFLGKHPFLERGGKGRGRIQFFHPGLLRLEERVTPTVDPTLQLAGDGVGASETPWYALLGDASFNGGITDSGGAAFDVSEKVNGKDVFLGNGVSSLDIVGDADQGSLYMAFDPVDNTSLTDGDVYYRMRIGDITASDYTQRAYVGMDFNGDGQVDLYVSANGSSTDTVEVLRPIDNDANPLTIDNDGPETTAFSAPIVIGTGSSYIAVTLVSATSDPQPGDTDIGSDGAPDQFVSWKVSLPALSDAWKTVQTSRGVVSPVGLTQDSPFRIISFTFGSVTVEDPKLTDVNGVIELNGGVGSNTTDGYPVWDEQTDPPPDKPAGLDVYSKPITLTDLIPPVLAGGFAFEVPEEVSTLVTNFDIEGSNAGPSLLFSISGTDADDFTIDAATGVLTFKSLPDFEIPTDNGENNVYNLFVTATNLVGSDTQPVTVTVLDLDDAPPVTDSSATVFFPENSTAPVKDVDASGSFLTFSLSGGEDAGLFSIDPGTGVLSFKSPPNFEAPADKDASNSYLVTVLVTNPFGSDSQDVTVLVTDVAEAPVAFADAGTTAEDTPLEIAVLANDTDEDAGQTATLVIGSFDAVSVNGGTVTSDGTKLTYTPAPNFFGTDSFTYTAMDSDGLLSESATVTIEVTSVDDFPLAVDDALSVAEDSGATLGDLGANDIPSGDGGNVWTLETGAGSGVAVVSPDGSFTYTPSLDFTGSDSFTYRLTDADGDFSIATVFVTVTSVDDFPLAVDDALSVAEDSGATLGDLGANDIPSGDGGNVWTLETGAGSGVAVVSPDGSFTYTPSLDFTGSDSFTYRLTDADGDFSIATVFVTVTSVDDFPLAVDDALSVAEDSGATLGDLGANDTLSGDGGNVWTLETGAGSGVAVVSPDGSFTYTPSLDFTGSDSFTYRLTDADGDFSIATVFVTVTSVDDFPLAVDDALSVAEDSGATLGDLGANDIPSGDGGNVWTLETGAGSGVAVVSPDGSFTYTPSLDFTGSDSFTYRLTDADGDFSIATVFVTVTSVNDAPNSDPGAVADFYTTDEDVPLLIAAPGVLENDNAANVDLGEPLTISSLTPASNGVVVMFDDGSFTYTPNPDFNGVDSFTYIATDGELTSDSILVTITVNPVNDAPNSDPAAVADFYVTDEDVPLLIAAPGVLENDNAANVDLGEPLTSVLVTGPINGSLELLPDGSFTYTPALNFNGEDSFTYMASDGELTSDPILVTITVNPVNDAPNSDPGAVADFYATDEDVPLLIAAPGVLENDNAANVDLGEPLTSVLVAGPTNGVLELLSDGSFTYTPALNFNGEDSFTYRASDGELTSDPILVTITVNPVNDAPNSDPGAVADFYATNEDVPLLIAAPGVLENDNAANVDLGEPLTSVLVTGPINGSLELLPDGSFTYTPNPDFNGEDSFTYIATDGELTSDPILVTITVNPVNDAPNSDPGAVADFYVTDEDVPLLIAAPGVLENDNAANVDLGEPLTSVLVTGPINGVLELLPDGSFTYTPALNFNGEDSFTYMASDGELTSDPILVTITVNPVNDAPNSDPGAVADFYATDEDVPLLIAAPGVLENDNAANVDLGELLTISSLTLPSNGALVMFDDGSFTYTPALNFNGEDSFTYIATDGELTSDPILVTILVNPVNDVPVLDGGDLLEVSILENTTFVATIVASDPDPDALSYTISGGADAGFFTIDSISGDLSFVLAPDFETPLDDGLDNVYTVEVQVSDGVEGALDTQTVLVTVLDVPEEPPPLVAVPLSFPENSTDPVTDLDAVGTGLTFTIFGGADGALFSVEPGSGVVSFITPPDFEAPLDADSNNVYEVVVEAATLYGSDLQGLSVTVLDIPEIDGGDAVSIDYLENDTIPVVDINVAGDNTGLTFSLSGPDSGLFSIDTDGVINFLASPDFETPLDVGGDNVYDMTVLVSGAFGSDIQDISVNVLDLDEKVEAGPITLIPDTGIPDDLITNGGNPVVTFPGEEGLILTLFGPDDTKLIEGEHYTIGFADGIYTVTLLDAVPSVDDPDLGPIPDPDLDSFGSFLADGTPTGNPAATADGLYRIEAEDLAGNTAEVGSFFIDTTPPLTGPLAIDPDTEPLGDLTTSDGNPTVTFAGEDGLTTFVVSFADPITLEGIPLTEGAHYTISSGGDFGDVDANPLTTTLYTITLLDANLDLPGAQAFGDFLAGAPTGNPAFTGDGLYSVEAVDVAGNSKTVGSFEIDTDPGDGGEGGTVDGGPIRFVVTGDNLPLGTVIGTGSNGTVVNIQNSVANSTFGSITPFPNFTGEVRVAWADFNGDGNKDLVVGAGPGGGPHVKVIDTITGVELASFFAFDPAFRGGVYVSAGDFNGDGFMDVLVGAGGGGGPHVKTFDGVTHAETFSFFAYDVAFRGGVSVGAFDYNSDGKAEIVTGAVAFTQGQTVVDAGPHVKVFDGGTLAVVREFMAYALTFHGGVYVAAGDFGGDGVFNIITGAAAGGGPHVKVFSFATLDLLSQTMAYAPGFGGGVRVGLADGNGDGLFELIVGAGPGGGPHVKVFSPLSVTDTLFSFFSGAPSDRRGVFVA